MLWWQVQRLKSRDVTTRLKMVEELASSGKLAVVTHVAEALKTDDDAGVRVAAAKGLGMLRDDRGLDTLAGALSDTRVEVRIAAVQSLRQIGDTRAIEPLVKSLMDPSHHVRWHVATALTALGWLPRNESEMVLRSVALGQHEEMSTFGKGAVEVLIKTLEDPSSPKRQAVALALGKIGDARAIEPLERATEDEDGHLRVAAVEALSMIGASQCTPALMRRLQDKDHRVRAAAVEALGRMGETRLVEPIAEHLLGDGSWEVRKLSVEALGRIRHARAPELLWRALNDADYDVRQAAAASLAEIPEPNSIAPLVLTLKDENSSVRQAAKAALRRLDRQWELSPIVDKAIPELEAALNHREYWVAHSAADTLAKINDMRQRHENAKPHMDAATRKQELAITVLSETLRDIDRDLRQAAAEALGRIVDGRVVTPLVGALDDQDEWVARAAALALNHLNWEPAATDNRRATRLKELLLQN